MKNVIKKILNVVKKCLVVLAVYSLSLALFSLLVFLGSKIIYAVCGCIDIEVLEQYLYISGLGVVSAIISLTLITIIHFFQKRIKVKKSEDLE